MIGNKGLSRHVISLSVQKFLIHIGKMDRQDGDMVPRLAGRAELAQLWIV